MTNILVTGGAGYIGSHACKALFLAGYTPVTFDNLSTGNRWAVRWGPLEIGDLRDPGRVHEVMASYRPAGILHFAGLALVGESMLEPARYWSNNVAGTQCLLDAARVHGVGGFVLSSTCAVYGVPRRSPIPEDAPTNPVSPYGGSKLAAEEMLRSYGAAYRLPYLILRYFNAAGADPDGEAGECRAVETHLLPLALEAALRRRAPLRLFGTEYPTPDGTAVRDYVHVSDLADVHVAGLRRLLAGGSSETLNVGTGRGASVREVIAAIGRIAGRKVPVREAPRRAGDPPVLVADARRAREVLGVELGRSDLTSIVSTAFRWQQGSRPALDDRSTRRAPREPAACEPSLASAVS